MNSRERVVAALNHQQPDGVPLDLGASPTGSASTAGGLTALLAGIGYDRIRVVPCLNGATTSLFFSQEKANKLVTIQHRGVYGSCPAP